MKRLVYPVVARVLSCILGTGLVFSALWFGSVPAHAQLSYLPLAYNGPLPLCRLGINGSLRSYPLKPLRLGWYVDYTATATPVPGLGITYFPVVRLRERQNSNDYTYSIKPDRASTTEAELRAAVAAQPGLYWLIGNEPDRKQFQDDLEPPMYARAYHDLYHLIKEVDPSAKIVAGTIVQPTPVRLEYLDMVLESYFQIYKQAMPVDGWSFHNFILNEASCEYYADKVPPTELFQVCWGADIPPGVDAHDGLRIDAQDNDRLDLFMEQVIRFRQWMAARGYRNTPAFLSEFGILMPQGLFNPDFTSARVNAFMNATFDFLLNTTDADIGYPGDNNRLVQRFAWYSVDDNTNHNGFMFNPNLPLANSRSAMGDNFVNYANAMEATVDLFPSELSLLGAPPLVSQGATTITLQTVIGNSGDTADGTAATVRFFNGDPNSGGAQIGTDQTISLQGCGDRSTVRMEWGSVPPGSYTIYVQVQTNENELDAANNQRSMTVSFTNEQLLLPQMKRELILPE